MRHKVYIASHDQKLAGELASCLIEDGFTVISSWVFKKFDPTSSYTEPERFAIADTCVHEVRASDMFILLSCEGMVPGGKFVELGVALGKQKPVLVVGRRENMLCWHPSIDSEQTLSDALKWCRKLRDSNFNIDRI